jgi:hypothetical protein
MQRHPPGTGHRQVAVPGWRRKRSTWQPQIFLTDELLIIESLYIRAAFSQKQAKKKKDTARQIRRQPSPDKVDKMVCGKVLEFLASILAACLLLFTTIASIILIFSDQWYTSSAFADIGLACAPSDIMSCTVSSTSVVWDALTTTDQKAIVGLLSVAALLGAMALFFLIWSILCFCCLLTAGGLVASLFAFLQFACFLAAVLVFAAEWHFSTPAGYSMGSAYIVAIICVFLSLIGSILAAAHHKKHYNNRIKDVY